MTKEEYFVGFRIAGPTTQKRRLTRARDCFHKAAGGELSDGEGYLSAFTFSGDFVERYKTNGESVAGFQGPVFADYLWVDIDRPNIDDALTDTRRLVVWLMESWAIEKDVGALVFFSGSKGFHVGIPVGAIDAEPGLLFHAQARSFCELMAEQAGGIAIDTAVYDKVRPFRLPNSRHPKTNLFKVGLSLDELWSANADHVRELARHQRRFEPGDPHDADALGCFELSELWKQACAKVEERRHRDVERVASGGTGRVTASTLRFIRDGDAPEGEREKVVFQCAANLAECGVPDAAIRALLEESSLDTGLTPREVEHAIQTGIQHGRRAAS